MVYQNPAEDRSMCEPTLILQNSSTLLMDCGGLSLHQQKSACKLQATTLHSWGSEHKVIHKVYFVLVKGCSASSCRILKHNTTTPHLSANWEGCPFGSLFPIIIDRDATTQKGGYNATDSPPMYSLKKKRRKDIFTENRWIGWTAWTPYFRVLRKKKNFLLDLEIFLITLHTKEKGEAEKNRRHLGEGWWSRKHETGKRGTGLCFAKLSRTPSDSPACNSFLVPPTIEQGRRADIEGQGSTQLWAARMHRRQIKCNAYPTK